MKDAADERFSSLTEYWDHLGLKQTKPGVDSCPLGSDLIGLSATLALGAVAHAYNPTSVAITVFERLKQGNLKVQGQPGFANKTK